MHRAFTRPAACVALAVLLAACGGSDGDDTVDNGNTGGGGTVQSQFGSGFQTAFDQPATADPVALTATSLGPVDFTTDPVALP